MPKENETTTEGLEAAAFDIAFEAAAGGADAAPDVLSAKPTEDGQPEEVTEPAGAAAPVEGETQPVKQEAKPVEADPVAAAEAKAKADKEEADRKAADAAAENERKESARIAAEQRAAQEQLTEEEQAAIALADKDFPEVGKAYAARERVLVTRLTNEFKEALAAVEARLTQQIAPVAHTIAANSFETAILKVHPDAFDVMDKVNAWVATKPAFMQKQLNDILDYAVGGAQATIDVFNLFKAETGSAQSTSQTEKEKEAAAAAEADKTKKLQSQEGVQSRSTQKAAAVDPEDFDGAYEKFAATSA